MNIAKILKYCPKGTKLYSLVDGEVTLKDISDPDEYPIKVVTYNGDTKYYTKDGLFFTNRPGGECVLFPSKKQRDWSKFRIPFEVGDTVMTVDGETPFIFKEYIENIHAHCYCGINSINNFQIEEPVDIPWTSSFIIPASEEAKKELFDKMKEAGYRWNANTLELEKIPKFKEGDVLINKNTNKLFLFTGGIINDVIQGYLLFANNTFEFYGLPISSFKLASSEDRDKVYFTLAKKGYKYDKEQHRLIKQEFKQFDKVLVRDAPSQKWSINLFSYYDEEDEAHPYVCLNERYSYCIPYEDNEYLVGKTINPPHMK